MMQILLKTLTFSMFIFFIFPLYSQNADNLEKFSPEKEYENIYVKKLDTNKHSSGFLIWIKSSVKLHKHERHTEHVYVLEGEGVIVLGGKEFKIKPGDLIFIPENTSHSVRVTSEAPMKVLSIQAPEFKGQDRVFLE